MEVAVQPHTLLLATILLLSLLYMLLGRRGVGKEEGKKRSKVHSPSLPPLKEEEEGNTEARSESADDENDNEDDYEKPALEEDLEHLAFIHEEHKEGEMVERSAEFYRVMNKRRTLR